MRNLGAIEELIIAPSEEPPQYWDPSPSLPTSPPYREPQSSSSSPAFPSPNRRASGRSSPSTPSDFEFDPMLSLDVADEAPASPKFISSNATEYWGIASPISESRDHAQIPSSDTSTAPPIISTRRDTPILNDYGAYTHVSHSGKQPSTPSSSSVRQLIIQELREGKREGEPADLDFYSAPRSAAIPQSNRRTISLDNEPPSDHYVQQPGSMANSTGRRTSRSLALDRHDAELVKERAKLTLSKSEPHAPGSASAPASSSSSPFNARADKYEEDKSSSAGAKKPGTSKSSKKWAFKDLLRRTVPSSKADSHYITKTLGAPSSPKTFLSSGKITSSVVSLLASPPRSHINHPTNRSPSRSTLQDGHPTSRTPQSPSHHSPSTLGRHRPFDAHVDSQRPSTPSRTPTPSPPRSPLSPHAAHYRLQKAHSQELGRKTFLPYRQSLLGCLGGSDAFSPNQLVW